MNASPPTLLCRAPHPALETRWLARHDRQLPVPQVFFVVNLSMGGCYASPSPWPQFIKGIEVPPSHGAILVNVHPGDDGWTRAVLAHEFRHHWQRWNGWKYDGAPWQAAADVRAWVRSTRRYFTRSRSEMDALRYETRRGEHEHSRWTFSLCRPLAARP